MCHSLRPFFGINAFYAPVIPEVGVGPYSDIGVFSLLDLPSQVVAVQDLIRGRPAERKIEWLRAHATITLRATLPENQHQIYSFTSPLGHECVFFIDGDEFVFIGDHFAYTVKERA